MHDVSHEDLAVLLHAGEAPPEAAAALASCPECRPLLEALSLGSLLAARAAEDPPAALRARAFARATGASVPWTSGPPRRALAFAVLCAVAVAVFRWDSGERLRLDDLDGDLARARLELDALAESIGRGHEQSDLEDDLRDLQGDAASLRRQLGG